MSYSYSISKGLQISVCPVDGITIDLLNWKDEHGQLLMESISKDEALRLASAIIDAFRTGYVMNDDGSPIEPLTKDEAIHIALNRLDPFD